MKLAVRLVLSCSPPGTPTLRTVDAPHIRSSNEAEDVVAVCAAFRAFLLASARYEVDFVAARMLASQEATQHQRWRSTVHRASYRHKYKLLFDVSLKRTPGHSDTSRTSSQAVGCVKPNEIITVDPVYQITLTHCHTPTQSPVLVYLLVTRHCSMWCVSVSHLPEREGRPSPPGDVLHACGQLRPRAAPSRALREPPFRPPPGEGTRPCGGSAARGCR